MGSILSPALAQFTQYLQQSNAQGLQNIERLRQKKRQDIADERDTITWEKKMKTDEDQRIAMDFFVKNPLQLKEGDNPVKVAQGMLQHPGLSAMSPEAKAFTQSLYEKDAQTRVAAVTFDKGIEAEKRAKESADRADAEFNKPKYETLFDNNNVGIIKQMQGGKLTTFKIDPKTGSLVPMEKGGNADINNDGVINKDDITATGYYDAVRKRETEIQDKIIRRQQISSQAESLAERKRMNQYREGLTSPLATTRWQAHGKLKEETSKSYRYEEAQANKTITDQINNIAGQDEDAQATFSEILGRNNFLKIKGNPIDLFIAAAEKEGLKKDIIDKVKLLRDEHEYTNTNLAQAEYRDKIATIGLTHNANQDDLLKAEMEAMRMPDGSLDATFANDTAARRAKRVEENYIKKHGDVKIGASKISTDSTGMIKNDQTKVMASSGDINQWFPIEGEKKLKNASSIFSEDRMKASAAQDSADAANRLIEAKGFPKLPKFIKKDLSGLSRDTFDVTKFYGK